MKDVLRIWLLFVSKYSCLSDLMGRLQGKSMMVTTFYSHSSPERRRQGFIPWLLSTLGQSLLQGQACTCSLQSLGVAS